MKFLKEIIVPAFLLLLICTVMTALLALTNQVTQPIIRDLDEKSETQAKQLVLPEAASFTENEALEQDGMAYTVSEGLDAAGQRVGMVLITSAKGYGGDVRIMTGVDPDGVVTGVKTLTLNETPGLGMKAQDAVFLKQFIGKTAGIALSKTGANGNEIRALTGATITSNAVTTAVNLALELFEARKDVS